MQVTADTLALIAGQPVNVNMRSTLAGLQRAGIGAGLERPHRVAHYLAQLAHESGSWRYDRELWGPTAAQKRYEGRADLGNVQPGDGSRFRGRGPIQITGRANYAAFTNWARAMTGDAPDFTRDPDAVNTDPWEGLVPIWYWHTRGLNRFADTDDIETITRRINGGLNGYEDRRTRYVRAALVLLGHPANGVAAFQRRSGLKADGIAGSQTRRALHSALRAQPLLSFSGPAPAPTRPGTMPRPVDPRPAGTTASPGIGALIVAALIIVAIIYFTGR